MTILENVSLKQYNTFGIEATAKYFSKITNEDDLIKILKDNKFLSLPKFILGGGSNVLLKSDFEGLVLKIEIPGIEKLNEDEKFIYVKAGAGEDWHNLVLFAIKNNLGGIENLSLIPGTVGAAPMQNIGAYGQEIKDTFYSLHGLNLETYELETLTKDQCNFGYRSSIFKHELKNKFIITSVTLRLAKNPKINIEYGTIKEELAGKNHR